MISFHRQPPLLPLKRGISRWLKDEDDRLLQLYDQHGPSWAFLGMRSGGRSPQECRRRYFKLTQQLEGPDCTKDTDRMIRDGWERAPSGDWVRIPLDQIGPSPFASLCRLVPTFKHRWEKKAHGWMPEEKRAVIEGFFELGGGEWERIAAAIPRRTADQCRRMFEKEFILHACSDVPEVEQVKEELFAGLRDGHSECTIAVECDE